MIHPITMGRLTELLRMENHAVAIYRTDRIPEGAHVPETHCIIPPLLVRCSNLGHVCAADNEHAACHGSKSGLGFGGVANRQRSAWSASVIPESERATMKHMSSGQSLFMTPEIALLQMEAVKDYGDGNALVVLSTASPYKFPAPVSEAIGLQFNGDEFPQLEKISAFTGVPVPENLSSLRSRKQLHNDVIDRDEVTAYVLGALGIEK